MARPNFFIVGAPKCGTTAMSHFLRQHPEVAVGAKEVYYFGADLGFPVRPASEAEYVRRVAAAEGVTRVGETSVFYLQSRTAPEEIRAFDPDAAIIAMLRNPVEMVYSLHSQLVYVDSEDIRDFETALGADDDRRAGRRRPRHPVIARCGYRETGRYSEHLARYFDVFGRGRVHTVIHEDLRADPQGTFAGVCAFLGVDPTVRPEFAAINPHKRARSRIVQRVLQHPPEVVRQLAHALPVATLRREVATVAGRLNTSYEPRPPMRDGLRRQLRAEFAPEVASLSELLGRDLTGWSRGEAVAPVRSRPMLADAAG
jgi:hypothetical protein